MRTIPILLAALLLAGCFGASDETTTTTSTTTSSPAPLPAFTLPNSATGCYEAIGVLLVDMAVAQASLPANWTAADAQAALQTPQPTGKGAIWFNGYTCTNSTMANGRAEGAEFGVLVKAPRLSENSTTPPALLNIYQIFQASNVPAVHSALGLVDFPTREANVTVTSNSGGASPGFASILVGNATRTLYSFDYSAFLPSTFTGTADFWHEVPEGMGQFHFEIADRAILQGAISTCNFPDPAVQKVTGVPSCGPTTQAFVVVIPDQEWQSEFRWNPGMHAVASS